MLIFRGNLLINIRLQAVLVAAVSCLGGFLIHGCVKPGVDDVSELRKIQKSIMQRSPQDRKHEALGLMTPQETFMPLLQGKRNAEDGLLEYKLTLQQAITRTMANNPEIAIVSFDPDIKREKVIQAAAEFDYTVFGGYSISKDENAQRHFYGASSPKERGLTYGMRKKTTTGADIELAGSMVRSVDNGVAGTGKWYQDDISLSVTQPLLRNAWPEVNLATLRVARLNYKISISEFNQKLQSTIVDVVSSYYGLVQAREDVEIARWLVKESLETYAKVMARTNIDATEVEVRQAQSAASRREALLIDAEKNAGDAQDRLLRLLGDEQLNMMAKKIRLVPNTPVPDSKVRISQTDQLLTALRLNPELDIARYGIKKEDIRVMVAKNQMLPELNLTVGGGLEGGSPTSRGKAFRDMNSNRFFSYNAALTFEYPLGNREREALWRERKLVRRQAIVSLQNTADEIAQKVKFYVRDINSRYKEIQVRKIALEAANKQLVALNALGELRPKLTPEYLRLKLDAQVTVGEARRDLISAKVDYNVAMVKLAEATGTILEMNQVKLSLPVITRSETIPASEVVMPKGNPKGEILLPDCDILPATQPAGKPAPPINPMPAALKTVSAPVTNKAASAKTAK